MELVEGKEYWIKAKLLTDDNGFFKPLLFEFREGVDGASWIERNIEAVEAIPEREKVTIPNLVAEWLKMCKEDGGVGLSYAILSDDMPGDVFLWLHGQGSIELDNYNQDTFARAWLDGYEVEKEPLYTVEIPDPNRKGSNRIYLGKADNTGKVFINKGTFNPEKNKNLQLTESEIKKDFEWAWQWAKPVEEDDE